MNPENVSMLYLLLVYRLITDIVCEISIHKVIVKSVKYLYKWKSQLDPQIELNLKCYYVVS